MKIQAILLICAFAATLSACGGGGGNWQEGAAVNTPPTDLNKPLAAGVHKLTFSAISTASLDVPISGIEVAVRLPAGLSVSTATDGTGQITPTSVKQGNALQDTSLAFGSYSASTRTAYFAVTTPQDDFRNGQYLTLLFTVSPSASVSPNDIYTLNAAYPVYKVVGLDTVTHNTVVMTGKVKTTLGVVGQ
jgi:hypothetical protein